VSLGQNSMTIESPMLSKKPTGHGLYQ
jgi:hypothetical protein